MFILGLSGKKHSGKSTVANHLVEKHGFLEMSWADPLKVHIGQNLMEFNHEQVFGDLKDTVDEFWGDTPRAFLQKIGTDLFREMDEDFWVKIGSRKIKDWEKDRVEKIVVSDCRFPNEFKAIKDLGGFTLRVAREDYHTPDFHESETALDGVTADGSISAASGNIDGLCVRAEQFLAWCRTKHNAAV
jgi:hypothetical protein